MDVGLVRDLAAFFDRAGAVGILALDLVVLAVGAHRGWWAPGSSFRKLEKSEARWRRLALELLNTADKTAGLAEYFRSGGGET